jgi:hypothetical protein
MLSRPAGPEAIGHVKPGTDRRLADAILPETAPDLVIQRERVTRIELALSAWEADVLPLNYTRGGQGRRSGTNSPARWLRRCPSSYRNR